MAALSARDRLKAGLGDKTKEAYDRKDSGGLFKSYLNEALLLESKVSKFNPAKDTYIIDIIPYEVGENDPRNKKGDSAYVLDIMVHMGIGPSDDRIVCLAQYNQPCPICELIKKKIADGADYKTEVKPLVAKRRTLYNIIVRENPAEEKKGVQLFEIAHFFIEKNIAALSKNPRKGGYIIFSDPDEGKSISFRRTGVGPENTGYDAHQFVDRPEPITDEELEGAKCLDSLIVLRTYDDIYAVLHAGASKKEKEEEQEEQEEVVPPKTQRRKPTPPPEEPETEEEGEEEVPEPKPEPKSNTASAGKKTRKAPVCPIEGGTFGKSLDEFTDCDTCNLYEACESAMA